MVTITLLDNGKERYTHERDGKYFGRKYDNISEAFKVIFPKEELDNNSTCVMIIVHEDTTIDHINVENDKEINITDNLSQHDKIKVGFSFQRLDGYVKNSEWQHYYFYDALKPDDFVPTEPELKKKYDLLVDESFIDVDWKAESHNVLQFFNIDGKVTKEINLTGFVQEQSDMAETDDTKETFVKNKSTKYLQNEGEDGSSPYATQEFVRQNGGKIDSFSINGVQVEIKNKNVDIPLPTIIDLTEDF